MALTEDQKRQLNQQCNRMPLIKIVEYIDKGFVQFPDDLPGLSEDRKKAIQDIINARPNPQEQKEWNSIAEMAANLLDPALKQAISTYQARWQASEPIGDHLADADALLQRIKDAEIEITRAEEEKDWLAVDTADWESLKAHLKKYPTNVHMAAIDDALWQLTLTDGDMAQAVKRYQSVLPHGQHIAEAQEVESTYSEWQTVRDDGDLFSIEEYLQNHPDSVFHAEATQRFQELKEEEIQSMRELQANYPIENLLYYLEHGTFTEEELTEAGVATSDSIQLLRNFEAVKSGLPDVNAEIAKCKKVCAEGHTDVFLFGIPSTGKSCILMGLIGSPEIFIDPIRAGGPYSDALQQYLDAGITIGQTPKNFVATMEASISDGKNKHLLNLVEMSGEDFAFKIADNENGKISFEDMGNGATRLLCNNNRKVFFIIVDPTARVVAFNHLVEDDEGSYLVRKNVNQRVTLNRMVGLLRQPENKAILKKVESIHIIVTKSDTLGSPEERDKKARDHFIQQYQTIIRPLTELCKENGINRRTGGQPRLYTFSLGQFYVGGVYQYDPTDANKLVEVLKHDTESYTSGGFFDKMRQVFNS